MMETLESSSPNKGPVYDPIRKRRVALLPEEKVRQELLRKMTERLSYPIGLLAVERSLRELCGKPRECRIPSRRVDIAGFFPSGDSLLPLLLIECKESASDEEAAFLQAAGYNHFFGAPFLVVAHPKGETLYYPGKSGWQRLPYLPSYFDLLAPVRS